MRHADSANNMLTRRDCRAHGSGVKACLLGPLRLRSLSASYLRDLGSASLPASGLRTLESASLLGAPESLSCSRSLASRSRPWLNPRPLRSGSRLLSVLRSLRLSLSLASSGRLQTVWTGHVPLNRMTMRKSTIHSIMCGLPDLYAHLTAPAPYIQWCRSEHRWCAVLGSLRANSCGKKASEHEMSGHKGLLTVHRALPFFACMRLHIPAVMRARSVSVDVLVRSCVSPLEPVAARFWLVSLACQVYGILAVLVDALDLRTVLTLVLDTGPLLWNSFVSVQAFMPAYSVASMRGACNSSTAHFACRHFAAERGMRGHL